MGKLVHQSSEHPVPCRTDIRNVKRTRESSDSLYSTDGCGSPPSCLYSVQSILISVFHYFFFLPVRNCRIFYLCVLITFLIIFNVVIQSFNCFITSFSFISVFLILSARVYLATYLRNSISELCIQKLYKYIQMFDSHGYRTPHSRQTFPRTLGVLF